MSVGRSHWGRYLAALGLLGVMLSASSFGALNCETQQCVEVATNNGQVGNNCWVFGSAISAYSTSFANKGYGQDSKGGKAITPVDGFYRQVKTANRDCPNLAPVSGTATAYWSGTTNKNYNTKCDGS